MSKSKKSDLSDILEVPENKLFDNGLPVDAGLPPLIDGADGSVVVKSSLLKKGEALHDELSKKYPYYDKTYQTKPTRDGGTPWASSRNEEDQMVTKEKPTVPHHESQRDAKDERWLAEMGVKKSDFHETPEFLPPREDLRDYGSDEVEKELEEENSGDFDTDMEKTSSLLRSNLRHTSNKFVAAQKVASIKSLKGFVSTANIKMHDQHLVVNLPRSIVSNIDFDSRKIATIENEISKVLNVRAKYAHFTMASSFDGVALEFLLV